jgi:predicted anti-sigma-YlaC factor YlaD
MCEFSGKWVAWMDGELPAGEAAEIKQHLECCAECRGGTGAYKRVSEEIVVYCDHVFATEMREWSPRSVAMASAVGAIAVLIALIFVWPRMHVPQHGFEG